MQLTMCGYNNIHYKSSMLQSIINLIENAIISQICTTIEMINKCTKDMIAKFYEIHVVNGIFLL